MNGRVAVSLALAVAVLSAATGCTGSKGDTAKTSSGATTTTSSTSPPPSSSSSAPPTPSEIAKSQVVKFLPTYYATLDRLASSATLSLNLLDSVATGANAIQEKTALAQYRENGWIQIGTTVLTATKVTGVNLASDHSSSPQKLPTVLVTTCIDVSDVREVDKKGRTVTLPTRPNFFVEKLTVVNLRYPSATGWRVSEAPNKGATSCAGV